MEQYLLLIGAFSLNLGSGYLLYLNYSKLNEFTITTDNLLSTLNELKNQNQEIKSKNDCLLSEIKDNFYQSNDVDDNKPQSEFLTADSLIDKLEVDLDNYEDRQEYFDNFYDELLNSSNIGSSPYTKKDIISNFNKKAKKRNLRI